MAAKLCSKCPLPASYDAYGARHLCKAHWEAEVEFLIGVRDAKFPGSQWYDVPRNPDIRGHVEVSERFGFGGTMPVRLAVAGEIREAR